MTNKERFRQTLIAIRNCFADSATGRNSYRLKINQARDIINVALEDESLFVADTATSELQLLRLQSHAMRYTWQQRGKTEAEQDNDLFKEGLMLLNRPI